MLKRLSCLPLLFVMISSAGQCAILNRELPELLSSKNGSELLTATKDGEQESLYTFIHLHASLVYSALLVTHTYPVTNEERYVIVDNGKGGYVQCIFHDNDTQIYCEAASEFYKTGITLSKKQRMAIAAQGFNMDGSKGNFKLDGIRVNHVDRTLWRVSELMLKTLYMGYGVDKMHVMIDAPLLHKKTDELNAKGPLPKIFRDPQAPAHPAMQEYLDKLRKMFTLPSPAKN